LIQAGKLLHEILMQDSFGLTNFVTR